MQISITTENLNNLATRVASTMTELGFSKNGKGMVNSQALRLIASLAGYREEHSFIAALKAVSTTPIPDDQTTEVAQPGEHPWYGREQWGIDVGMGITDKGYPAWVAHCIDSNGGVENHCPQCGKPHDTEQSEITVCENCVSVAYTERSFELGAMSRDELYRILDQDEFPSTVYDQPSADIRAFILEQEFPE